MENDDSVDNALTQIKEKYNLNDAVCNSLQTPVLQANENLKSLDLFQNSLGTNALKIISESAKQLTKLDLKSNCVRGEDIAHLTELKNLEILDLSKNGLTDKDLTFLPKLENLKELYLYYNKIGNVGIAQLIMHPSIEFLDVHRNRISNKGVESISKNTKLKTLIIGRNAITEDCLRHLLQSESHVLIDLSMSNIDPDFIIPLDTPFAKARGLINVDENNYKSEHSKYLNLQDSQRINTSYGMKDYHRIVLSIDGGGIRGLIPAMIIEEIQKQLIHKLEDAKIIVDPNTFALGSLFDLIAGTSTGGLIALGLTAPCEEDCSKPRKSIEDILKLYSEKGTSVFKKKYPFLWKVPYLFTTAYDPRSLETELHDFLGDTKLSQSIAPLLITAYDLKSDRKFLFRSSEAKKDEQFDFYMRYVGRSTSAAPTYYKGVKVKSISNSEYTFIDGGVFANNPSYYAIKEAEKLYGDDDPDYLVISLGTGTNGAIDREYLSNSGMLRWGFNITDHLMANIENNLENSVKGKCKKNPAIQYLRIQVRENADVKIGKLDDVTPNNIENLKRIAQDLIKTHDRTINQITHSLYNVYIRKYKNKEE